MTATNLNSNPAVQVAKEESAEGDRERIRTLKSGVRVRFVTVPDVMIQRAVSMIDEPPVPNWYNPDKDREEPNPNDPEYMRKLREAERDRGIAVMDAAVMFGAELVDPVPESDGWVRKLKFLNIQFDETDPYEREFAYLRFIAFSNSEDLSSLLRTAQLSEEDVQKAAAMFPGDEARPTTEPDSD